MSILFATGVLGGWQIFLILAVLLLFFGGSKLPGLAKGLGQSIKEFKKGVKDEPDDKDNLTVTKNTSENKN